MTTVSTHGPSRAESLRGLCSGAVHLPGDPGYDEARMPWNLAVGQRPAAVAGPSNAEEVSAVVRAAVDAGLRIAPQGTGHNAGPLGPLDDVVLLRTSAMKGVSVDAERQTARVEAGAVWLDAVQPTAAAGLAALHGSSPDVGVVGYSLGGGIGWYARKHGLAANTLVAAEVVLADGSIVRADADSHADLFWALRGGGGSFGVVTAVELRLFPIQKVYGGMLVWDQQDAERVLRAWAEWCVDAPDQATTAFRLLNVPPMPDIPPQFQGRSLAVIDGAVLGSDEEATELLAPLRALEPEMDMFGRIPAADLVRIHMDPEGPTPGTSSSAVLAGLPDEAIDLLLAHAGPGSGTSLLSAELRQLGGAASRPHPGGGALAAVEGEFVLFAVAIAATPEMEEAGFEHARTLTEAMAPFATGGHYLNFAEKPVDVSLAYPDETWRRLSEIRAAVDPGGVFVANHPVPPPAPDQPSA